MQSLVVNLETTMQSIRIYSFAIACCLAFCLSPVERAAAQTEVVVKDTMSDFELWADGTMTPFHDALLLRSTELGRPDELRFYIGFTPTESVTLSQLALPNGFSNPPSTPINNPDPNPFQLSVKLYDSLAAVEADQVAVDGIIPAPINDWQSEFLTDVNGFSTWSQVWDLSAFDYQVNAGQTYYLTAIGISPNADVDQQAILPLVSGVGDIVGSETDYFYVEGAFGDLPIPLTTIFAHEQAAVRLTAISNEVLLGDINCDGAVNLLDVAPFVDLLSTGGFSEKADINQDGAVDLLDVQPFVNLLSGG